jgi:hypothetical protein
MIVDFIWLLLVLTGFPVRSSTSQLCSGRGYRDSNGDCQCSGAYYGPDCQFSKYSVNFNLFEIRIKIK